MKFNKNYKYHFIGRSTHDRFKPIYSNDVLLILNNLFHPNLSKIIFQYYRYNFYIDELLFETSHLYLFTQSYVYYQNRHYSTLYGRIYWVNNSPKIRSIKSRVVSSLATILTTYHDENRNFKLYNNQSYRWIIK
jgi:hypothetical protein